MRVLINAVHFNADQSLIDFVQKKLSKLDTFYDKIIGSEVFLKLDKGEKTSIHKKLIEVKLNVPGNNIFVKESGDSFEEATDKAMDVLTRQVKRIKQKTQDVSHEKPQAIETSEAEEIEL